MYAASCSGVRCGSPGGPPFGPPGEYGGGKLKVAASYLSHVERDSCVGSSIGLNIVGPGLMELVQGSNSL